MKNTVNLPVFEKTAPYGIPAEFYRDGFRLYQKKYVMRRNYLMMLLFGVLFISFVVSSVKNPSNTMSYVLMMVCAAMIFMLWYNPRKQRRSIVEAVKGLEQERYEAQHDGKVLRIHLLQDETETDRIPESRLLTEQIDVQETEQFYLVCDGKRMFYILPKEALKHTAEERSDTPEIPGNTEA